MKKLTDQEILNELKCGNTSVFQYLYNDFDKITSFIRKNSGGEEEAKDFFHEALIVLYEKITTGTFSLDARLSTFLYATCKNLWLNYLRKNKPMMYKVMDITDVEQQELVEGTENDHPEMHEQRLNAIMKLVEQIKEPCYSILMKFYFHKLSYKTIADQLDYQNEKSVKNQKYRCLQRLKESLPNHFFEFD